MKHILDAELPKKVKDFFRLLESEDLLIPTLFPNNLCLSPSLPLSLSLSLSLPPSRKTIIKSANTDPLQMFKLDVIGGSRTHFACRLPCDDTSSRADDEVDEIPQYD